MVFLTAAGLLGLISLGKAGSIDSCPSGGQLSCHNTTKQTNLCCFNSPGGSLLQTQFWDTDPTTGPSNSWTIHGLWPDNCDGTYQENCDSSRDYTDISSLLTSFGQSDTLNYMNTYWKNQGNTDEELWEHEWATHGTCISTYDTSCYTGYQKGEEAVDFFVRVVSLFQTLPTYEWLSDAGITPSSSKTYTSSEILNALSAKHGQPPQIQCSNGALDQVYYYYNVQGSVQSGEFVAAEPDTSDSSCPSSGIKYLPKSGAPVTTTSSSTGGSSTTTSSSPGGSSTPPPSGGGFSGKGYLMVTTGGSQDGCIISGGTWLTTGTCATFTATASGSGFTLTSSKGKCAVQSGALTCSSSVSSATVFTSSNGMLAYSGKTAFYASAKSTGSTQETVYTGSKSVQLDITWQST